ncbi:MAG: YajQ family cyclic di-GMP-binding protein [Chloroflexia bacterium]|nr:YajQ family cyclic di-GMP-binding protein [Chloroflexia bacterium]MDQ3512214.1 YajQ family cyclic di-GMP-binding protein [Chloroflexota bacterium]
MASVASFDIVSSFDRQELKNAIDQTERDVQTRYDLKDSGTELVLDESKLTLTTDNEYTAGAVRDILESKFVRRGLSLKILDYGEEETASGGRIRQVVTLREGISTEIAKDLTKRIRDEFKKVTPQIQGDAIRVQAKNKDDLQAVIQALKSRDDLPIALQFTNYR